MKTKQLNPNYRGGKYVDCVICGGTHYRTPSRIKDANGHPCCSLKCLGLWRSTNLIGKKSPNYKGALKTWVCIVCEHEFTGYHKERIYCSVKCKIEASQNQVLKACDQCGKFFSRPASYFYWHGKRGHKKFFCSNKCNGKYHTGENSPAWISDRSQIKDQNKTIRWSNNMVLWRKAVYERDDHVCQVCKKRSCVAYPLILNAHHIEPFSENTEKHFDINNGITLCEQCHKLTYGKEKSFEDKFKKIIHEKEHR